MNQIDGLVEEVGQEDDRRLDRSLDETRRGSSSNQGNQGNQGYQGNQGNHGNQDYQDNLVTRRGNFDQSDDQSTPGTSNGTRFSCTSPKVTRLLKKQPQDDLSQDLRDREYYDRLKVFEGQVPVSRKKNIRRKSNGGLDDGQDGNKVGLKFGRQ